MKVNGKKEELLEEDGFAGHQEQYTRETSEEVSFMVLALFLHLMDRFIKVLGE